MKRKLLCITLLLGFILFLFYIPRTVRAVGDVVINEDNFPDEKFREYVSKYYDTDSDSILSISEIEEVTSMDVSFSNLTSLKGVEFFTYLSDLDCQGNKLTILDLSKNLVLEYLDCDDNEITELDVSNSVDLIRLSCCYNKLNSLDFSNNTSLLEIFCNFNELASLDISKNTDLEKVNCSVNQLINLDLSNNTKLRVLECQSNELTSLDVSGCSALTDLKCDGNQLTSLDVSGCSALTYLDCEGNQLTSLDVSGCSALTDLDCGYNQLASLDVSGRSALKELDCNYNQLTSLNVNGCSTLTVMNCRDNQLTSLDVSGCSALTDLYCEGNQLTSLDVSECSALIKLYCGGNQLKSLDVSRCSALIYLYCEGNQLTSLDVGGCSELTDLFCYDNQLTSLDLSSNEGLAELSCYKNTISRLNISACPYLINTYEKGVKEENINDFIEYIFIRYSAYFLHRWCYLEIDPDLNIYLEPLPTAPLTDQYPEFEMFSDSFMDLDPDTGKLFYTEPPLKYNVNYDERWFFESPKDHNYNMALLSLATTMASISDTSHTNADHIVKWYQNLGFSRNYIQINYQKPMDNTVGSVIALKNIQYDSGEVISLLAVSIRSGGYGTEWAGNFNVGTNTNHAGFDFAAGTVVERIKKLVDEHPGWFKGKLKIWVTGFSRGAATANLVAAKLDDGSINSLLTSKGLATITNEDVFAYCFECPQTTVSSDAQNTRYDNICNITNPIDLVPKVPSTIWDFKRYGKDYYINTLIMSDYYTVLKPGMMHYYDDILKNSGLRNSSYYVKGLTEEKNGQSEKLGFLVDFISDKAKGRQWYSWFHQSHMMNIVRRYLGGNESRDVTLDILAEVCQFVGIPLLIHQITHLPVFPDEFVETCNAFVDAVNLFVEGDPIPGDQHAVPMRAHYPELELSWLLYLRDKTADSGNEDLLLNDLGTPDTVRYLYVSGEADISIYNKAGILVGRIANEIAEEIQNGVTSFVNSDNQKICILPNDMEYHVDVVPLCDGKLTYTCVDTNFINKIENHLVSYKEVNVHKGETLTGIVENITEKRAVGEYKLYLGDQEVATPVVQDQDEIESFEITVSSQGFGTVYGGGVYHAGDSATAMVLSGVERFKGWYVNGNCVSTETKYTFTVENDLTVTGVFDDLSTERIREICVDGVSPIVGMSVEEQLKNLTIPSDCDYSLDTEYGIRWYCETTETYMEPADIFEADKEYSLKIAVNVKEGFAFSEEADINWLVNDEADLADAETSYVCIGGQRAVLWTKSMISVRDSIEITRLYGKGRYETSFLMADQLKEAMEVEKFESIVIACGTDFADALAGSYLAAEKNAPILLVGKTEKRINTVADYVKKNLSANGTVYILGGTAAIPEDMDKALSGIKVERLAGAERYETNTLILKAGGVKDGDEIFVCTGKAYADSLSVSSVGKPILLVKSKLTTAQINLLKSLKNLKFTIIGGESAVSQDIENVLKSYGTINERLSGKNRFETSIQVAEKYFDQPDTVTLVYSHDFPDGLSAGPYACYKKSPTVLTRTKTPGNAKAYVETLENLKAGYVIGGEVLISDETIMTIFGLEDVKDIISVYRE